MKSSPVTERMKSVLHALFGKGQAGVLQLGELLATCVGEISRRGGGGAGATRVQRKEVGFHGSVKEEWNESSTYFSHVNFGEIRRKMTQPIE